MECVTGEGGTNRFLGTHLDQSKGSLREQKATAVDRLLDAVSFADTKSIATVLAGDFNDVPKSRTLGCFEKRWQVEPRIENRNLATYPSESPRTRIDYVAVDQAGTLVLDSLKVVPEPLASDHRPVVGELVIP